MIVPENPYAYGLINKKKERKKGKSEGMESK
jgi:hypothetical protein